jgi:hypothetical protein
LPPRERPSTGSREQTQRRHKGVDHGFPNHDCDRTGSSQVREVLEVAVVRPLYTSSDTARH